MPLHFQMHIRSQPEVTMPGLLLVATRLKQFYLTLTLLVFLSSPVWGIDLAGFERLKSAKSLKCEFPTGYSAVWKDDSPKIKKESDSMMLHFDSINLRTSKPRVIGNQAAGDVSVISTASSITFVEVTEFGNLISTTVFSNTL
jgi:hypothetical protein